MKKMFNFIIVFMIGSLALGIGSQAFGQLDDRFGAKGVEATQYLGQFGLSWFRDWEDSYLPKNYPALGKNKIWTLGKIDYRTDGLGMDYRWILLDLLENSDDDLLQSFFDLCIALIDSNIVPVIGEYWTKNQAILEKQLADSLNQFTFTQKKYGIKYRAKCKKTEIAFQDTLPKFEVTVRQDTIRLATSVAADWKTHIYIEAWVLNPNPFRWKYYWQDVGDADCVFHTVISLQVDVPIIGVGRERYLQVKAVLPDSRTESEIDWNLLGISFTWEELSNAIEDLVDDEIESALKKELNKPPVTDHYYLIDFFKPMFSKGNVPTQSEILDRIWQAEQNYVRKLIEREGFVGQYWSIGYEPNWYPMLRPKQYAEFFLRYYQLIKTFDPTAKVMGPSIFLTEAVQGFDDIAWQFIPELLQSPFLGIRDEFKKLVNAYFRMANCKKWYQEFIAALPPGVKIDVNDLHVFPISSETQGMDFEKLKDQLNEMALFMRQVSGTDVVWVSEFGNIDYRRTEAEAAELCRILCEYFKTNEVGIQRWFWFLSKGHSPFYDLPFAPNPPVTALLKRNNSLTLIGETYLRAADNTPPVMTAPPSDDGTMATAGKITFSWKAAQEYDTGISDYRLELRAEPGGNVAFREWVGNKLSHEINYYAPGTLYARVQAKNGAGLVGNWSEWSDGIIIKPSDDSADDGKADEIASDQGKEAEEKSDQASDDSGQSRITSSERTDQLIEGTAPQVKPSQYGLSQNYPNPFNGTTAITFNMPTEGLVRIEVFDIRGTKVKTLINEFKPAGRFVVQWDGSDESFARVASGVYIYRMTAAGFVATRKMVLVQ
ncbi:MAG: glycosyl hydrolase [candidate division KSB1 bacterium]|nr:glycosyl hydrolase [candidate division KSB1 bacterium]